jgi:Peptidase_C39 like family
VIRFHPVSGRRWVPSGLLFAALMVVLLPWVWRRPLQSHGGLPFARETVLPVPQYFQGDPAWGDDPLGSTTATLSGEGCAVTSAAMVLGFYGIGVDPGDLNAYLKEHDGYEGKGWIRWERAAEFSPGKVEKAYEDLPSYARIDWNLLRGNPVIVRIRRNDGITHFVVIVGKRGLDYLIRDPSRAGGGRVYPLSDLGVPIEALRYYRRIPGS